MEIGLVEAAALKDRVRRLDHDRRPGEIRLEAGEALEVGLNDVGKETGPSFCCAGRFRQYRRECQILKSFFQFLKVFGVIKVALIAHAEIEMNRSRRSFGDERVNNRFDRTEAGSAGKRD